MDGKVVLITGGNAGLGLESTKRLAEAGATVVFTSRDADRGARAASEVDDRLRTIRDADPNFAGRVYVTSLDLCDLSSVKSYCERLADVIGEETKIDVLMNNAGVTSLDDDGVKAVYRVSWPSKLRKKSKVRSKITYRFGSSFLPTLFHY